MTGKRGRPAKLPTEIRRALVIDAAVEHFAAAGRADTSIDEIAKTAGVRKPSIYEMFGSKDDLFRAVVEHELEAMTAHFRSVNVETAELELPERTRRRVDAAVAYAEQHPQAFRLMVRAPFSWPDDDPEAARKIRFRLIEVMADNYRRESPALGMQIDTAAEVLARLIFAMADEIVQLYLADTTWDREALVDFLAGFIQGGITGTGPDVWAALERAHSAP